MNYNKSNIIEVSLHNNLNDNFPEINYNGYKRFNTFSEHWEICDSFKNKFIPYCIMPYYITNNKEIKFPPCEDYEVVVSHVAIWKGYKRLMIRELDYPVNLDPSMFGFTVCNFKPESLNFFGDKQFLLDVFGWSFIFCR